MAIYAHMHSLNASLKATIVMTHLADRFCVQCIKINLMDALGEIMCLKIPNVIHW